jgi:FKBP-type peptidyl-prolyl cis-trans isomerase
MKLKSLLTTSLLGLGAATAVLAQEVKLNIPGKTDAAPAASTAPTAAPAAPAASQVSEQEIMETFGWFVTARLGISELNFTPDQIQLFTKGVALAAAGKQPPHDLKTVGPVMDEFIGKRQQAALAREKAANIEEANAFFVALKKRPGVTALADGLCYEILKPGQGPNVKATDTVKIDYKGMLINGQVFDSTEQHGGEPLTIELDKAIPGWAEGVQQINKGGKIKLYIPPQLAYGDDGAGAIPPGSALVFEIEVLDVNPPAAPAATAPAGK